MDLKMHLEIVAPFVKMAKKSTMCNCQLQGTAATRSEFGHISSRRIIFQTQ
jgi:hypothetical protein